MLNRYTLLIFLVAAPVAQATTVHGTVRDAQGRALPGARVFLEPGYGNPLEHVTAGRDGTYQFPDVEPGLVGVFAISEGYAFGGASTTLSVGETDYRMDISLREPGTVSGRVRDMTRDPVADVSVSHALLLGESPVGIPFVKLRPYGFTTPQTDEDGDYTAPYLPKNTKVALKFNHIQFAQETITDVSVGSNGANVTLDRGVFVMGEVRAKDSRTSVANASIIFRSAAPPHESLETETGNTGRFAVRLKPGTYLYQAAGSAYRSPGWERLEVTGEHRREEIQLYVSGMGRIKGKVLDAVSGEPVEGARFVLKANGATSAVTYSGPQGEFEVPAVEGENILYAEGKAGYRSPEVSAMRANVVAGKVLSAPEFWLAPIPEYAVQFVDTDGAPAAGVFVRVLRPVQFGWWISDDTGAVRLNFARLPEEGPIVGVAEAADTPHGALFALSQNDVADSVVQLFPLKRVYGRVTDDDGDSITGAVVGGVFAQEGLPEPQILWRTVSRKRGYFEWNAVVPHALQRCMAWAPIEKARRDTEPETGNAESIPYNLHSEEEKNLGRIVISDGRNANSVYGDKLDWLDFERLGGPGASELGPAVILFAETEHAEAIIESAEASQEALANWGVRFVVVVENAVSLSGRAIPVMEGSRPGQATTYLLDERGRVVLETFGLPPLRALQDLYQAPAS